MDEIMRKVFHDLKSCAAKIQYVVEDRKAEDIDDRQFKEELQTVADELQEIITKL